VAALRLDDGEPTILISKREEVSELVAQPFESVGLTLPDRRDIALHLTYSMKYRQCELTSTVKLSTLYAEEQREGMNLISNRTRRRREGKRRTAFATLSVPHKY